MSGVQVLYSIGVKFAGGGIGNIAYHAVRGLLQHKLLKRLLCGSYKPTEIPAGRIRALGWPSRGLRKLAVYENGYRLNYLHNLLYDWWAARQLEACDLFHGWGGFSLRSFKQARACGAVTVVEWASSYPRHHARILQEEHRRWGLRSNLPERNLRRVEEEFASSDYVLIPSDFVRRTFIDHGFPEERLIQIPFGVDTDRFRPLSGRSPHPFRALFVGQVTPGKGIMYLLEAWRLLNWKDAELWIVGRMPGAVRPLLMRYTQWPTIRWFSFVPDPDRLYQQADVFVFPSVTEGSALVTYEALATGLPVVTTADAGSVIRDGKEGFIIPIQDVGGLANRLDELRTNASLRLEMGRAARQRAEEFTWSRYEDRLAYALAKLRS